MQSKANAFRPPLLSVAVASILAASTAMGQENAEKPRVELETSMGQIVIELDPAKAPKTVANFLQYVKNGHYDGTVFHRVIDGFMIQGGGMDSDMKEKQTRPPIVNEASNGLLNKKYTVAMARTSEPDTATSQFFINVADNDFLDDAVRKQAGDKAGYAVFGKVIKGMDAVDQISKVETGLKPSPSSPILMRDVPVTPVLIKKAKIVE